MSQTTNKLFSLPLEIREMIWDYALMPDTENPLFGRSVPLIRRKPERVELMPSPFQNPEYQKQALRNPHRANIGDDEPPSERKPSCLSLAATCRQAYQEVAHIYYKEWNQYNFELYTGYLLNRFVNDILPVHVQAITKLTLHVLTRPKKYSDLVHHAFSMRENRGPLSLALIKHFHGLIELTLRYQNSPKRPCQEFLEFLIEHAYEMKRLKFISMSSLIVKERVSGYVNFKFNTNDISDWTYSCKVERCLLGGAWSAHEKLTRLS